MEELASQLMQSCQYSQAADIYEQCLTDNPSCQFYAWMLGLAYLLQGQEEEAQMVWSLSMMDAPTEQEQLWIQELVTVLTQEAQHQEEDNNWSSAQLLRQHAHEIAPEYLINNLRLLHLFFINQTLTQETCRDLNLVQLLSTSEKINLDHAIWLQEFLITLLQANILMDWMPDLISASLPHFPDPKPLISHLIVAASDAAHLGGRIAIAIRYTDICLTVVPNDIGVLNQQAAFYHQGGNLTKVLEITEHLQQQVQTLEDQVNVNFIRLNTLLRSGGQWIEAQPYINQHKNLLDQLIKQPFQVWNRSDLAKVIHAPFPLPYIQDHPSENRFFQTQILSLSNRSICTYAAPIYQKHLKEHQKRQSAHETPKKLKIGYVSHCMRQHSVGWLARWLFDHHDRTKFEVHAYFIMYGEKLNDPLQEWYSHQADYSYKGKRSGLEIAEAIYENKVDILIDLDSATADVSCEVIAVKPAPIQATWLGWDASGMSAIDYYIADSYSIPNLGQTYYQEKLWRLPNTYLGINGFEVGTPTLTRQNLGIPQDAIIYFSAQSGYKRNPKTINSQLEILKNVPNSYFLVKDIIQDFQEAQEFFETAAQDMGISPSRLRFLSAVDSEMTHRANLGIADIVLDTYPYNGATTTLETLWMGVPLVTRVGQQFSARNSYTFMMNAGVTEGIAWTDEEYVEWGIRLGTDEQLRKEVAWKLRQSRKSAPLWNGQQFTRDMEAAYRQMWERYCHS